MNTCMTCENAGQPGSQGLQPLDEFVYPTGMKNTTVVLIKSVTSTNCSKCGEQFIVPDLDGLNIAIAVARTKLPAKLMGEEIRFIRKAMEMSAKDIADLLEVSAETISRWENDKLPMSISNEKLFRLVACFALSDRAKGVDFSPEEITKLRIPAIRQTELTLQFQRVRLKTEKTIKEVYADIQKAA